MYALKDNADSNLYFSYFPIKKANEKKVNQQLKLVLRQTSLCTFDLERLLWTQELFIIKKQLN